MSLSANEDTEVIGGCQSGRGPPQSTTTQALARNLAISPSFIRHLHSLTYLCVSVPATLGIYVLVFDAPANTPSTPTSTTASSTPPGMPCLLENLLRHQHFRILTDPCSHPNSTSTSLTNRCPSFPINTVFDNSPKPEA
jgi:hypothetical protein